MKFVLQIWPDIDSTATPAELVRYAIASTKNGGDEMSWDIFDDNDKPIAIGVIPSESDPAVVAAATLSPAALVKAADEAQSLLADDDRPCWCGKAHTAAEHGYDPDKA